MKDNQIINGIIGKCDCIGAGIKCRIICKGKRYDTDPSAWDADLTKWIEDNELMENMQYWLYAVINDEQTIMCKGHSIMIGSVTMGRIINATPAQKASALAQAIRSVTNEHTR